MKKTNLNMDDRNTELFKKIRTSRTFSNILDKFSLQKKSVLDIGCSKGHYLQVFGEGSVGVTIIDEHVEEAEKRGLKVVLANVENPDFNLNQKFDALWANNLFEHLNSPHPFLNRIRKMAKEDSTLILGVPVIPYLSFLTRFKKFRGAYAVSHVNFFNRKTLIETVKASGWEVKEARLFYFKNPILDSLMNIIAPHMYIIATQKKDFSYHEKRLMSLKGYEENQY
jgi:cyclopropane fatty-acyl-phospholipid synthase-like methyltransferase